VQSCMAAASAIKQCVIQQEEENNQSQGAGRGQPSGLSRANGRGGRARSCYRPLDQTTWRPCASPLVTCKLH
jgi:hypothetical protein